MASHHVFGADAEEHPVTVMPLEKGRGALSHDKQAELQCDVIEQQQGKEAADEMRAKVKKYIDERDNPKPAAKGKAAKE